MSLQLPSLVISEYSIHKHEVFLSEAVQITGGGANLELDEEAPAGKHALDNVGSVQAIDAIGPEHTLLNRHHGSVSIHHEVPMGIDSDRPTEHVEQLIASNPMRLVIM